MSSSRAKALLWPSIPNPRHSNALQKLGRPCKLVECHTGRQGQSLLTERGKTICKCLSFPQELLESTNILKVEEGDTDSLQIVDNEGKQEEAAAASAAEALLPWHPQQKEDKEDEDEDHTAEISAASINGQPTGSAAAVQPYIPADAFTGRPQVDLHTATLPVVASGYTTLEMFQQATPQGAPASTQLCKQRQQEENGEEEVKPSCSYIRKLRSNSTETSVL